MNSEENYTSLVGWYGGFDRVEFNKDTGKSRPVSYRGIVLIQVKPGTYFVTLGRKEPIGRIDINTFQSKFEVSCSHEYLTVDDFIQEKWEWRNFVGDRDWDLFRFWDHPWNIPQKRRIWVP